MARPKKTEGEMAQITFKLPEPLKKKLEVLAFANGGDVSSLLVDVCSKLVEVNAAYIDSIESARLASTVQMPFGFPTKQDDVIAKASVPDDFQTSDLAASLKKKTKTITVTINGGGSDEDA